MPQNMTHVGVSAGKHDIDYEGESRVVTDKWTLNDYDPDNDGSGNDFDPAYLGITRLKSFEVYVADGSAYVAQYDEDVQAIRLYNVDGTGEVAGATTVDVDLKIVVRGQG